MISVIKLLITEFLNWLNQSKILCYAKLLLAKKIYNENSVTYRNKHTDRVIQTQIFKHRQRQIRSATDIHIQIRRIIGY